MAGKSLKEGSKTKGRSRRERKAERKKLEILKSAAAVFRRNGYYGATLEEISDLMMMTKGSLYYYFKSKEEILYFCQDYSLNLMLKILARVARSSDPPDEKLRRLIAEQVSIILDELGASAMHIEFSALRRPLLRKIIAKRDRYERGVRAIVQEGIDRGIFVPCDPKLVTFAIFGAVNWTNRWFSPEGPLTARQIGQAFADYLVRGLLRKR